MLGLRYAQTHPDAVSELVLAAVATGSNLEVNLLTRGLGRIFPAAFERCPALAQRKIDALGQSINRATEVGIGARANVVLPNRSHVPRVHRLLNKYSDRLSVRVLSSLADGDESLKRSTCC